MTKRIKMDSYNDINLLLNTISYTFDLAEESINLNKLFYIVLAIEVKIKCKLIYENLENLN